jgi:chromosome segregation ATPase
MADPLTRDEERCREKDTEIRALRVDLEAANKRAAEYEAAADTDYAERMKMVADRDEWRQDNHKWKARATEAEAALAEARRLHEIGEQRMAALAERATKAEADLAAAVRRRNDLEDEWKREYDAHTATIKARDAALARVSELEAKLDQTETDHDAMVEKWSRAESERDDAREERDAALACVAELEAQRDELKRLYCREHAAGNRFDTSPRNACLRIWPTEADRLFPPDGR